MVARKHRCRFWECNAEYLRKCRAVFCSVFAVYFPHSHKHPATQHPIRHAGLPCCKHHYPNHTRGHVLLPLPPAPAYPNNNVCNPITKSLCAAHPRCPAFSHHHAPTSGGRVDTVARNCTVTAEIQTRLCTRRKQQITSSLGSLSNSSPLQSQPQAGVWPTRVRVVVIGRVVSYVKGGFLGFISSFHIGLILARHGLPLLCTPLTRSVFDGTEIPTRIPTAWGHHNCTVAFRLLLQHALQVAQCMLTHLPPTPPTHSSSSTFHTVP